MAALDDTGCIPQFYAGRTVFITGATGFMGKVLVERLLSTCPDIGRLFLLMRTKRDMDPEQRLTELKASQVFDSLRLLSPGQLDKLRVVSGDITQPGLGVSVESLEELREVSIVFHSAATLKFNEVLKKATEQNVLSVMRLLDICNKLPNVQAFVYVSTAFSNADLPVVEESVYPPPVTLDQLMDLVNEDTTELINTESYISPKPNTYTFTKAMAETAVHQHGNRGYPVAIFRPTIVKHPYPGWIENVNGPSGVFLAVGEGVLHVFRARGPVVADLLPVDIAIDTLIAVAWETAVDNPPMARVYNCSVAENPTTWEDLRQALVTCTRRHPQSSLVWYPFFFFVENRFLHKASELLLQTTPLYLMEYTSRVFGVKKRINLITASRYLRAMNQALHYFALREWTFNNENVRRLRERLAPADRRLYNLDPKSICWKEQYLNFVKGVKKYIRKDKDIDLPAAKKRLNRMYFLHWTLISFVLPVVLLKIIIKRNHRQKLLRIPTFTLSFFNAICACATRNLVNIFQKTNIL